jgi:hypothetical protein
MTKNVLLLLLFVVVVAVACLLLPVKAKAFALVTNSSTASTLIMLLLDGWLFSATEDEVPDRCRIRNETSKAPKFFSTRGIFDS